MKNITENYNNQIENHTKDIKAKECVYFILLHTQIMVTILIKIRIEEANSID